MDSDKARPRLAATLVVVRDAPAGLEVLLLQRADRGDHNSGAWVFPGGLLDGADAQARGHCVGPDDTVASALLGVASGGLDHGIAAIRETFEEAGLLFADTADGRAVDLQSEAGHRLGDCRGALQRGETTLAELCRNVGLRLRTDRLHYIAHWLTPLGRAKRFDTRFFLAVLPPGQASAPDAVETVQQVWLPPAQALSPQNTRRLMTPTRAVLEQLARFADTTALLAWAAGPRDVRRVLPRLATGSAGEQPVLPGDPAWDEIGLLDPTGRGDARCELQPGVPVLLAPGVLRLTATDGANSYLVAAGEGAWALVDPGPDLGSYHAAVEATVGAAAGALRWLCLTDGTTPAAAPLARGAVQVLGPGSPSAAALPAGLQLLRGAGRLAYLHGASGLLFAGAPPPEPDWRHTPGARWLAPRRGFLQPLATEGHAP